MDNKRKIFRIVMAVIWLAAGGNFLIHGQYGSSFVFFLFGFVFLASVLNLGKKE